MDDSRPVGKTELADPAPPRGVAHPVWSRIKIDLTGRPRREADCINHLNRRQWLLTRDGASHTSLPHTMSISGQRPTSEGASPEPGGRPPISGSMAAWKWPGTPRCPEVSGLPWRVCGMCSERSGPSSETRRVTKCESGHHLGGTLKWKLSCRARASQQTRTG